MHIDMQPKDNMNGLPNGERDREGAMAKADLYKLANYSLKLFKMMEANTQLEGWVQAKITKAADYVASVYHYMEYEMKFSEYGAAIDDSDVYSESQKRALRGKLMEAKEKIKDLKKAQAEKLKKKDEKIAEASGVRATDKKKGKVEKSEKKQYFVKLEKDGKTKGMTITAEEGELQSDVRDRAARDARSGGWSVASIRVKDSGSGEELDEAKKKGDGNLANNAKPFDKVTRGDVIAGRLGKDAKGGKDKKVDEAPNEGNEFSGELAAARKAGKKAFSVDGKSYPVKETAISGAPQKSGIAATAKTTVPGLRATGADLKKANAGVALGEGNKKKCPPMSHIKKMCQDGKTVAEICKMHPDCDQKELKQMIDDCKKQMAKK